MSSQAKWLGVLAIVVILSGSTYALGEEAAENAQAQDAQKTEPAPAPKPKKTYVIKEIHGWTVHVNEMLLTNKEFEAAGEKSLRLLDKMLGEIAQAVPAGPLEKLRKVGIYLDLGASNYSCAGYNPSARWAKQMGFVPEKALCVDISNAVRFTKWAYGQPGMIFHELAHAYHNQVVGYGHPAVINAYKKAMEAKLYHSVPYMHPNGRKTKAYAAKNELEYFAELTEAYFSKNDYYPFNRADLEQYDLEGFKVMQTLWEDTATVKAAPAEPPAAASPPASE